MTTQTCAVETCARPVPDTSFVCPGCGDRLRDLLNEIPDAVLRPLAAVPYTDHNGIRRTRTATDGAKITPGIGTAIDQAVALMTRFGAGQATAHTSNEQRLPFNPQAASDAYTLRSTLIFWAASIAEQRGVPMPATTASDLATFLVGQVDWLRAQAAGPDGFDELTAAIRNARRAIDRPADRRYAGPCTQEIEIDGHQRKCGTDLYAWPGKDTITCPTCGTDVPVDERRAWLLEQTDGIVLTVAELERAIDGLKRNTLKSWIARHRLKPHGGTRDGETARYRVGDVRALMEAADARKERVSA
jgi:hypothetical protein